MLKIMGISDEVTTCECCGKSNLKKTVALMDEYGNVKYYGEVCAYKPLEFTGDKKTAKKKLEKGMQEAKQTIVREIEKFKNGLDEYRTMFNLCQQLKNIVNGSEYLQMKRSIEEYRQLARQQIINKYGEQIRMFNISWRDHIYL